MNVRTIGILLITGLFSIAGFSQTASETAAVAPSKFDAALAKKVGADKTNNLLLSVLLERIDALVRSDVPGQWIVHRQCE